MECCIKVFFIDGVQNLFGRKETNDGSQIADFHVLITVALL
jgi:hypothetical protein